MKHKIRQWNPEKRANDIVEVEITAQKAIRIFCVNECMAGHYSLVPGCTDPHCPLFPYRMNTNPVLMQDVERREKARQRMVEFHQNQKKDSQQ